MAKSTGNDADPSKPVVSSTTVVDWSVRSAVPAGSEKPAVGKSLSAGGSLVEMVVQEVTGSLERGNTVRLTSFRSSNDRQSSDSSAQTDRLLSALGDYTSEELLELLYVGQEPDFFELMRGLFALSDQSRLALQNFLTSPATGKKAELFALSDGSRLVLQNFPINPETGNKAKLSPDRVMEFEPKPTGRSPSPEIFAESNAPRPPETENYEVTKLEGSQAHVVVVPKDDPLGSTVSRVVERVPEIARIRRQELTEKNIDALVELYLADDPIAEARRAIETDNARERARFLSDVACLTSKEIAQNAGHQAANASVTASRWKQQGKIFSVPSRGSELYPAFQFREGQPHQTVAKILRELPKSMSPWQIAFWFTSSNSWLGGATAADRLDDADAVVKAAHRENEPIVG
jgi:nucleoid DNA-binding protein